MVRSLIAEPDEAERAEPTVTADDGSTMGALARDIEQVFAKHGFKGSQVTQLVAALGAGMAAGKGMGDA